MGDDELKGETGLPETAAPRKKLRSQTTSRKRKTPTEQIDEPMMMASLGLEEIEKVDPPKRKKASKGKKKATEVTRRKRKPVIKVKVIKELGTSASALFSEETELAADLIQIEKKLTNDSQPSGQAENSKLNAEASLQPAEPVVNLNLESGLEKTEIKADPSPPALAAPLTGNTELRASQTVILPLTAIKVRNIVAKVTNLRTEIILNKVIVQGILHEQVFYVATDNLVHHFSNDLPFSTFLDIPGARAGMNAQATAVIEEIISELAADGLSLLKKVILEIFVKLTETVQLNLPIGTGPVLLLDQVVGENTAQTLVENDTTLAFPALKIEEIIASTRDLAIEMINDKVIVQGILHKQIFFVDTANLERHQGEDIPFTVLVDIPGITPGMEVTIDSRIEGVFFELLAPTLVRQKAVIEVFAKVTEITEQPVSLGNGPLFMVEEFVGENTAQELSETFVTLSQPALKVREIVASLQNLVSYPIPNKVIIQGTLHKQIYFIGTDNIEHHQAEDVPFSLFVDIPGVASDNRIRLSSQIEAVLFELTTATQLRQKIVLAITATATRAAQLNLVIGVGPLFKLEEVVGENTTQILLISEDPIPVPPSPITVTADPIVFPSDLVIASQQTIVQNTISLSETATGIKEISAVVTNVSFSIVNQEVLVQGVVQESISVIGADNIVRTVPENTPFSILVNTPNIDRVGNVTATVEIEEITYHLNPDGNSLSQILVLKATVQGEDSPQAPVNIVTSVNGTGIVTAATPVEGEVLTPDGPVLKQFNAVTDVAGPGIISTSKQTVSLRKIGETSPTPMTVVTAVNLKKA